MGGLRQGSRWSDPQSSPPLLALDCRGPGCQYLQYGQTKKNLIQYPQAGSDPRSRTPQPSTASFPLSRNSGAHKDSNVLISRCEVVSGPSDLGQLDFQDEQTFIQMHPLTFASSGDFCLELSQVQLGRYLTNDVWTSSSDFCWVRNCSRHAAASLLSGGETPAFIIIQSSAPSFHSRYVVVQHFRSNIDTNWIFFFFSK